MHDHDQESPEGIDSHLPMDVNDMEAASGVDSEEPSMLGCFAGDTDLVPTPSTRTSDHVIRVQGSGDVASTMTSATSSESISWIGGWLRGNSRAVKVSSEGTSSKYKLVNWFFHCLLAGALAYGVHLGLATSRTAVTINN